MTDAVWASMSNAMKIVEEADALLGTYDRAIASHDFGRFFVDVDDWTEETLDDENGWCTFYNLTNYRLSERTPRLASRGMVAFAISFYRLEDEAGDAWEGAKRAKFYAGFAPTAKAWRPDTMYVNGAGIAPGSEKVSDIRWGMRGRDGAVSSWFYALALDGLQGQDDFRREVLVPISTLLGGGDEAAAFANAKSLLKVV